MNLWPTHEIRRDVFWKHLMDPNAIFDLSCCPLDDFNEIECFDEKIRCNSLNFNKVLRMRNILNFIHGKSIPPMGC